MLHHIVMFKFSGSPEEREATARAFKADLDTLPEIIEPLLSIETGVNINPAEKWDLVLHAVVENMETLSAYSLHPAHTGAVAKVKPMIESRACVDYTD